MNDSDTELLLQRIINKYLIFFYNDQEYVLYQPDKNIKYKAEILYNRVINDEKYDEWARLKDTQNSLFKLGLWQMQTPSLIESIEKTIDNLKVDLYKNYVMKDSRKRIKKQIEQNKKQLQLINAPKQDLDSNTLESYAANIKNQFVICETLEKNSKKVFNNNEVDSIFFERILTQINNHSIAIKDFKFIARSQIWKSYWNSGKSNVFSGAVDTWTDDQRVLVNISKMYDSIYEHPECPDEEIIEDDDALDGWMIHQRRENNKKKKEKAITSNMNPKIKNAQHIYLPAESKQDIEDILSLNTGEAKHMYELDQKAIKEAKARGESLHDSQLPSTLHRVRQEMFQKQKGHKK